jgi:hypothetical protein
MARREPEHHLLLAKAAIEKARAAEPGGPVQWLKFEIAVREILNGWQQNEARARDCLVLIDEALAAFTPEGHELAGAIADALARQQEGSGE